jgi:hypothetical protein
MLEKRLPQFVMILHAVHDFMMQYSNSDCNLGTEFFDFNKSHDLIISPLSAT